MKSLLNGCFDMEFFIIQRQDALRRFVLCRYTRAIHPTSIQPAVQESVSSNRKYERFDPKHPQNSHPPKNLLENTKSKKMR